MKLKKIPMRMCVGCKELKPKKELLRIVALPTGIIELDRTGKKSGRGVYICNSSECFQKAFDSHGLERSLKRPVSRDVYDAIKEKIGNEPIYRLLGLCMKAGRLLSGSEQIKTAVKDGKGILLILAEDSSERTKEEYIRLAKLSGITWRIFGEKEKLGHAVGKGIRAAILISDSGFGMSLLQRIDTLK